MVKIYIEHSGYSQRGETFRATCHDPNVILDKTIVPSCDMARELLKHGLPEHTRLEMYHKGQYQFSLAGVIVELAKLTVREGDGQLRFVKWRDYDEE